jgi:Uma2 family endonuclease
MVAQEKLGMTAEAFLAFAALPENADKRLELLDGEIVEMSPSSKKNSALASFVQHLFWEFIGEGDLGIASSPDGGFQLNPHMVLQPDAAFIAQARIGGEEGSVFHGGPDIAVEVISPSESARTVHKKVLAYLSAGSRWVWAVYPEERVIEVCQLGASEQLQIDTLTEDSMLTADDILPGFAVPVKRLFAVLGKMR